MKKLTLQEKQNTADALLKRINALHKPGEVVRLMEVCGTHTAAISKTGIRKMLSPKIQLISGPGCPVCVTVTAYIDKCIELAKQPGNIL